MRKTTLTTASLRDTTTQKPYTARMKTNKIHLLDSLQSQQIAAGEVVERPANIVKELVENSIDAGATVITITIEKAGKKLITIGDNGCGMNEADATLCFARHATSKLRSVDELTSLDTFGFRGEALASIAAVATVTLTTKTAEQPFLGTTITYSNGIHTGTAATACPVGTSISIAQLFETLPVRKTFLKQDETEWNAIQSIIYGMALTHLAVSFTVIKDGTTIITAPAVWTLQDRITQLWNHTLSAQLTTINHAARGITVNGLISQPPYARYGKDLIMFWVNNRLVKNSDIIKAITKGYLQSLPLGKYPAAFLAITVDKSSVDVNIHPRKEEVRFTSPGIVASIVQEAVTNGLEQAVNKQLPLTISPHAPIPQHNPLPLFSPPHWHNPEPTYNNLSPANFKPLHTAISSADHSIPPAELMKNTTHQTPVTDQLASAFTIIGQLFNTYILIQTDDQLIMIDQHAAHERVLYHQYTSRFTAKEGTQLLFPETVTLPSMAATNALLSITDFFVDQGIIFSQTGPTHLMITAAPPQIQKEGLTSILQQAADFALTHHEFDATIFRQKLNEHVHSHLACKMAVKAGDVLEQTTMYSLVTQLLTTPNRFMCVHGRPTMWPISKEECEKRFKRR